MNKVRSSEPDRRVVRTRKRLRSALVAMILERGWDEVSVLDVCDRAEVARSTFYTHFADKEDLLVSGFDDLHDELHVLQRRAEGSFAFVEGLMEHASGNIKLFRAILGRKSGQVVQRRMRDLIGKLVAADLKALGVDAGPGAIIASYVSGGLFELLIAWAESPRRKDPQAVAAAFRRLTLRALGSDEPAAGRPR